MWKARRPPPRFPDTLFTCDCPNSSPFVDAQTADRTCEPSPSTTLEARPRDQPMRQLLTLLIAALLTEGARGFAWDGGTPPPHRRSLALLHARSSLERPVQRGLLQDCRNSSGQAAQPCTSPAPRDSTYGSSPDGLTQICGDRSAFSVLLVAVGVILLLIVFACGLGGLCSRRRRQRQQVDDTEAPGGDPYEAHAIGLADHHSRVADAECESVRAMSPDKQAELEVRPVREGDEAWGTRQECSICLEGVAADGGAAWMVFPCHHGACAACLADLVRYNRRPDRRVVHCPLCRSLALVPPACLPQGTLAPSSPAGTGGAAAAAAAAGHSGQASIRAMGDGSWRLFWLV